MHRSSSARALSFALAATLVAAPLEAQPAIRGSVLNFSGTADATDLGTPGVALDFLPQVTAATSGNTGSFASFNRRAGAGVTGSIADLLVGQGAQPIPSFLTFGGYRFTLSALPRGPFGQADCYVAPAPGQFCTPYQSELGDQRPIYPLSPFYMTNVATGDEAMPIASVVAFNLVGTVAGPRGPASDFFGTISTVFPFSYQEVLMGLEGLGAAGQPFPGITFNGTFVVGGRASGADLAVGGVNPSVVPEPSTWALAAVGLVGVGALGRRRRRV